MIKLISLKQNKKWKDYYDSLINIIINNNKIIKNIIKIKIVHS